MKHTIYSLSTYWVTAGRYRVYIMDLEALSAIIPDAVMPVHDFYCCLTIKHVIMSH